MTLTCMASQASQTFRRERQFLLNRDQIHQNLFIGILQPHSLTPVGLLSTEDSRKSLLHGNTTHL